MNNPSIETSRADKFVNCGSTNFWGRIWISLMLACFVGLGFRLVYIQTSMGQEFVAYKKAQQTRTVTLPARRGLILDARGRILAGSQTKSSVYADPQLLKDIVAASEQLSPILDLPPDELATKLQEKRKSRFVWLARRVSEQQADAVKSLKLPGIGLKTEQHRFYPNGPALAQVLGFVSSDGNGLEGLELQFNDVLSGEAGGYRAWCDAKRRPVWIRDHNIKKPVDGRHLVLTVDLVIQGFLESELQKAVQRFQAESAVGIVMSPRNGDVLAMACHPSFNPNYRAQYADESKRNRCLTDPVEPGSCFKPIIMSAALMRGVARLDEKVDCGRGEWYFGSRRIRDTHPNGVITFEEVLVKSSNIGMGHVGTRLGNEALLACLTAYGFGKPTGIELPGESGGIVPPLSRWTSYSTTSIPIGQELAVTPMQLIRAFSALANDGLMHTPRIVRAVLDSKGQRIHNSTQGAAAKRVIPSDVARELAQRALVRVVNASHHDIKLTGYQMLGKTGTAQVPYRNRKGYEPDAYLASFLGAAPASNPEIAVLLMVLRPRKSLGYYGGKVAGPAVKEIIRKTLAYWQMPFDASTTKIAAMNTEHSLY